MERQEQIKGWNWAAFLLTWIWGAGNNVWIALLGLIPGLNILVAIYLGMKGNELAWKKGRSRSVIEFQNSQQIWLKWGIVIVAVMLLASAAILLVIGYTAHQNDERFSRDSLRITDVQTIVEAVSHYTADNQLNCPSNLHELEARYLLKVPRDPNGAEYGYSTRGEECVVSATLEDDSNIELSEDADPANGRIYDLTAKNLNDYLFYQE